MCMPPFHETKHLSRQSAHLQSFPVEFTAEGIQGSHDFGNRSIAVIGRMFCLSVLSFCPNSRISFLDHLLAIVNTNQVVLENIVVEHVFSGLTEIYDPICECWR